MKRKANDKTLKRCTSSPSAPWKRLYGSSVPTRDRLQPDTKQAEYAA
jgi:hypothetical protein